MKIAEVRLTQISRWIAGIVAVTVALALPAGYFSLAYQHQVAALETEVEINASIITRLINADPELWRFEELRLRELLRRPPGGRVRESRRITDKQGELIVEEGDQLGTPLFSRTAPLHDSGRTVGRIEIVRSLRPLLLNSLIAAALGVFLGFSGYLAMWLFPLRTLRRVLSSLFAEKERAQVILRSIADGVIAVDTEGKIMMLNSAAEKITGWSVADAPGKRLDSVLPFIDEKTGVPCPNPASRVLEAAGDGACSGTCILKRHDDADRVIAHSGARIRGNDGKTIGAVIVVRDITDQKRMEGEMLKSMKLESLSLLAGGIAHDFNNILTTVIGNISLAGTYLDPGHPAGTHLEEAERAGMRAKALTGQLLTFSRGGAPVTRAVALPGFLRDSANFALSGSKCRAEYLIPDNLWPAVADEGQLNQVIQNLVINAVQAMPDGGIIGIAANNISLRPVSGLPLSEGDYVKIFIRDRGTGIAREHLASIFDPYFTTKKSGSGLGLATSYSIMKRHGGHITAESGAGLGTTITLYLPAAPHSAVPRPEAPEAPPVTGHGKVLVMDDERMIRDMATAMLNRLGYEAMAVEDGREAVRLYEAAKSLGKPFDAVMLDLTVPAGMGGVEALKQLAAIDPNVRAIVSSGYSDDPVLSNHQSFGFSGMLAKPYNLEKLSKALGRVITPRSPSARNHEKKYPDEGPPHPDR